MGTNLLTCHSWCLTVAPWSTERGRHRTSYPVTTPLLGRVGPQTAIYFQGRPLSSWADCADLGMWCSVSSECGDLTIRVYLCHVYLCMSLQGKLSSLITQRKEGWLSLCQLSGAAFSSPHPKPVPLTITLNSTKQNLTLWSYSLFFVSSFFLKKNILTLSWIEIIKLWNKPFFPFFCF